MEDHRRGKRKRLAFEKWLQFRIAKRYFICRTIRKPSVRALYDGENSMSRAGLVLTREASLKLDWADCAEKLNEVVTNGFKAFSGDFKAGAEAIFALLGAAKSIREDIPLGTKALDLIILCFAWSFDSLRASGHIQEDAARDTAKSAIELLKQRVELGKIEIPFNFFEHPTTAEPYQLLRDEFVRNRATYRVSTTEHEKILTHQFDSAFRCAVWAIWVDRVPALEELARALKSPAAKTADFERQWRSYRQSLINEFHVAPVFGQEDTCVSLGQLYVPLRCSWREAEHTEDDKASYDSLEVTSGQIYQVRSLEKELDEWLDNDDPNDWLRLIGGGPGSGKSTSAKAFAAKIANRPDIRPIFIPLQRLKDGSRLRESINKYFCDRSGCAFHSGPLERKNVEGGPRLLLIFDGLDEIARPGQSADTIARDAWSRRF